MKGILSWSMTCYLVITYLRTATLKMEDMKKEEHEAQTGIYNDIVTNEATIDLNLAVSEDNMDMLYEYDATYMDDSPFEYAGQPINLPNLESWSLCFESIENYSAEGFQFQL